MTAFEGEPDIQAEVRFSTTLEGGRNGPVCTNYRPCHDMGIDGMLNDGKHEFVDREWVALGDTVVSRIRFLVPEYQAGRLYEGMPFTIQEGSKIVGRGRVIRILNPALNLSETPK